MIVLVGAGLLAACAESEPTPTTAPTPTAGAGLAPTLTPRSTSAPTATPTVVQEPGCLAPPPLERAQSTAVKIDGEIGIATTLEASSLFEATAGATTFEWEQRFGTAEGVEYVTSHRAELSDATSETASFVPTVPGNYRFRLTARDGAGLSETHEVDVRVAQLAAEPWEVKGAIFTDLWGPVGGPEFDSAPDDPECLAQALDHALAGPLGSARGGSVSSPRTSSSRSTRRCCVPERTTTR